MGLEQTEKKIFLEQNRTVILAVDRNSSNLALLSKFLSREGYEVIGASSIKNFEEKIIDETAIKLAIIDVSGFDKQIWNCCEILRSWDIPFLIISPKQSAVIKQQGMNYGAQQFLVKPLIVTEFLQIIKNLIED